MEPVEASAPAGPATAQRPPTAARLERAGQPSEVEEQLTELGINVALEALSLRRRKEEIKTRLKTNPSLKSLPGPLTSLALMDWESIAFRSDYPDTEESFRVEFARGICHAVSILVRIDEELAAYHEKKGTEYLWKRHYDSLLYLLQEGRLHKQRLGQLAVASERKGSIERAKQLLHTADRLESGLIKVAAIFEGGGPMR